MSVLEITFSILSALLERLSHTRNNEEAVVCITICPSVQCANSTRHERNPHADFFSMACLLYNMQLECNF